jgi:hypothetical protein
MKILLFLLLITVCAIGANSQSTLPLRADTVVIEKTGGNGFLKIKDSSRTRTGGILTNIGGGVYVGKKPYKLNDTLLVIGSDTFPVGSGVASAQQAIHKENTYAEQEVNAQAYAWTQLASGVRTQWYDGVIVTSVNDTLIMAGGWNANTSFDSVFQSADGGITWTHRSNLPYAVHTPGFIDASDGYKYIIGGDYLNNSTQRATVYRTRDFRTYQTMTTTSPFGTRVLHAAVEYKGALYAGGGQNFSLNYTDGLFTDMYKSIDSGVTWTLLSNTLTHMGKNINGCLHVFNDRIYLVSGGRYDNDSVNKTFVKDVYSTLDGITWRQENEAPFAYQYPNEFVWDGKLWIAGGFTRTGGLNADTVAFMDKSANWHRYLPAGKPTATHAAGTYVFKDAAYFVLGNNLNDVWRLKRSSDMYYETRPYYKTRVSFDTIGRNTEGYNMHWNSSDGMNEFKFTNSGGIPSYMTINGGAIELKPSNLFTYEFNSNGFFRAKRLRAYTTTAAYQFDVYYNNMLALQANFPGLLLEGASNTMRAGLDGALFGIGLENPATTGIRFKHDITNGKTVIAQNTTNLYDVATVSSAALALLSTTSGFLPPVMTAAQRLAISSPATGLIVFDSDSLKIGVYDGSGWRMMPFTTGITSGNLATSDLTQTAASRTYDANFQNLTFNNVADYNVISRGSISSRTTYSQYRLLPSTSTALFTITGSMLNAAAVSDSIRSTINATLGTMTLSVGSTASTTSYNSMSPATISINPGTTLNIRATAAASADTVFAAGAFNTGGTDIDGTNTVLKIPLQKILKGSTTWQPGIVAAGSSTSTTVTVTGAAVGDVAHVNKIAALSNGEVYDARVSATNQVTIRVHNVSTGSANYNTTETYNVVVIKY